MKSNNYCGLLFVPAIDKFINNISECNADAVIIDLEDSIPTTDKLFALERVCNFLEEYSYKKDIFVRINKENANNEISRLEKYNICGYMLPKTETRSDIETISKLTDKKIFVLIESAKGILNLREIVSYENTDMIAFGAEDYSSSVGIKNEDRFLIYPKSKISVYGSAYNKPTFDTISLEIRDMDVYTKEVYETKNYGFSGKLAIHPIQIDIINRVFKNEDYNYYEYIIKEYDKQGGGVLNIDGKIFEKPHIDIFKKKLKNAGNNHD